jgi:hypothetical protein
MVGASREKPCARACDEHTHAARVESETVGCRAVRCTRLRARGVVISRAARASRNGLDYAPRRGAPRRAPAGAARRGGHRHRTSHRNFSNFDHARDVRTRIKMGESRATNGEKPSYRTGKYPGTPGSAGVDAHPVSFPDGDAMRCALWRSCARDRHGPWRLSMSYLCICIQHPIAPRARYRGAWAAAPSH